MRPEAEFSSLSNASFSPCHNHFMPHIMIMRERESCSRFIELKNILQRTGHVLRLDWKGPENDFRGIGGSLQL